MKKSLILVAVLFLTATSFGQVATALVIANSNYGGCAPNLPTTSQDADNMEIMLTQAGWAVVKLKDQTRAQINAAIAANIPGGSTPYLVYYSGHGRNTVAGQGGLIGVDCNDVTPVDFQAALGAAKSRTLVIDDACGSGGFMVATEDANHLPAFITATTTVTECGTARGIGSYLTDFVMSCASTGGFRTVLDVHNCLAGPAGYDSLPPPEPHHSYNGSLPTYLLGDSPHTTFCVPGIAGVMACPCGNPQVPAGDTRGCNNSSNTSGAFLDALGSSSVAADTLRFISVAGRPMALTVVFQGGVQIAGVQYGQGVRCVGSPLKRLYILNASDGIVLAPRMGELSVSQQSAALGFFIAVGMTLPYQCAYRDPTILGGCPAGSTFNMSEGVLIHWGP